MPGSLNAKLVLAGEEPVLDAQDAITTAYEWHESGGSAIYAFASNGGVVENQAMHDQLLKEIQDCMNYVQGNAQSIDSGKFPEYAEDTEAASEAQMSTSQWQLKRLQNLQDVASQPQAMKEASLKVALVPGNTGDPEALSLFLYNTRTLDPQRMSIIKNLSKKIEKGTYDPNLAWRLWLYWVDEGAKQFARENPGSGPWTQKFPVQLRRDLAKSIASDEEQAIKNGEYETPGLSDYKYSTPATASVKEAKTLISEDVFRKAVNECNALLQQVGGTNTELEGKLSKIQTELNKIEVGANGDLQFALDDESNPEAAHWARTVIRALDTVKRMAQGQVAPAQPIQPIVQQPVAASLSVEAGFGEDTLKAIVQFARTNKQKLQELMQAQGPQAVASELGKLPGVSNFAPRVAPALVQWLSGQMNDSSMVGSLEQVLTRRASLDPTTLMASLNVEAGFGEDTLKAILQFVRTNKQNLQGLMQAQGPQAVAGELGKIPGAGNSAPRISPVRGLVKLGP